MLEFLKYLIYGWIILIVAIPVNFIAKKYKIKYLNKKYNQTHLYRKEILNDLEFIG